MAIKNEDVLKAVDTIDAFCIELELNYTQAMEPLKGDDIVKLTDDRNRIRNIKGCSRQIRN